MQRPDWNSSRNAQQEDQNDHYGVSKESKKKEEMYTSRNVTVKYRDFSCKIKMVPASGFKGYVNKMKIKFSLKEEFTPCAKAKNDKYILVDHFNFRKFLLTELESHVLYIFLNSEIQADTNKFFSSKEKGASKFVYIPESSGYSSPLNLEYKSAEDGFNNVTNNLPENQVPEYGFDTQPSDIHYGLKASSSNSYKNPYFSLATNEVKRTNLSSFNKASESSNFHEFSQKDHQASDFDSVPFSNSVLDTSPYRPHRENTNSFLTNNKSKYREQFPESSQPSNSQAKESLYEIPRLSSFQGEESIYESPRPSSSKTIRPPKASSSFSKTFFQNSSSKMPSTQSSLNKASPGANSNELYSDSNNLAPKDTFDHHPTGPKQNFKDSYSSFDKRLDLPISSVSATSLNPLPNSYHPKKAGSFSDNNTSTGSFQAISFNNKKHATIEQPSNPEREKIETYEPNFLHNGSHSANNDGNTTFFGANFFAGQSSPHSSHVKSEPVDNVSSFPTSINEVSSQITDLCQRFRTIFEHSSPTSLLSELLVDQILDGVPIDKNTLIHSLERCCLSSDSSKGFLNPSRGYLQYSGSQAGFSSNVKIEPTFM